MGKKARTASFEIFHAAVPRHNVTGWNEPISLLEQLACYQVYEVSKFLDDNNIVYAMGWYGDPNPGYDDIVFRLLVTIPDTSHAVVFRLWSGIEESKANI